MKLKTLMMSAGVAAMVAGGALAQDTEAEAQTDDSMMVEEGATTDMTGDTTGMTDMEGDVAEAPTFTSLDEMTVGDVVGFVAYSPDDERIGEIDYVVEGADGGQAVIGIGGFLGLGEYTVALPLTDFELREDGLSFQLSTDKETLKEQPEFDETGVEGLPDETMIADLLPDEEATEGDDAPAMEEEPAMEEDATASDAQADAGAEAEGDMAEEDTAMEAEGDAEADSDMAEGDAATEAEEGAMEDEAATDAEADAEAEDAAEAEAETDAETTTQ